VWSWGSPAGGPVLESGGNQPIGPDPALPTSPTADSRRVALEVGKGVGGRVSVHPTDDIGYRGAAKAVEERADQHALVSKGTTPNTHFEKHIRANWSRWLWGGGVGHLVVPCRPVSLPPNARAAQPTLLAAVSAMTVIGLSVACGKSRSARNPYCACLCSGVMFSSSEGGEPTSVPSRLGRTIRSCPISRRSCHLEPLSHPIPRRLRVRRLRPESRWSHPIHRFRFGWRSLTTSGPVGQLWPCLPADRVRHLR